ncbi:hypothetical protein FACS1894211_12440 [Clostridia bacterium]|nr:hypothetical protein FACS1894211_12440 [Clostridia bacterium]
MKQNAGEYLKATGVVAKKALILIGIKLFMVFFAALLFVSNVTLNVVFGILVIAAECALLFVIGKGQARDEYKYVRINKSTYPDGAPLSKKARETSMVKAGIVAGTVVLFYSVFTLLGAILPVSAGEGIAARVVFQGIMKIGFSGITMICTGFGLTGNAEGAPNVLVENGGVFFAFYFTGTVLVAAAYFVGYVLSARLRMRQHVEIQQEIKQFEDMGRIGRRGKK